MLALITLDGKGHVRQAIDAGNRGREKMQDNKRQNRRKASKGAGAKTETPVCPEEHGQAMHDGLRILARIIARAHLRRQAHCGAPRPDP